MRSSRTIYLVAACVALWSQPASSASPEPIPLSDETRKALAPLGQGVVGKALPAPTVEDPAPYLNLGDGTWEFEIVSGDGKGKTQPERYEKKEGKGWERKIGDEYIEYLELDPAVGLAKVAEAALSFGYRSSFDPGIHEAHSFVPGDSVKVESKLAVSKQDDPGKIEYTGKMEATVTYEGAYEVTVPAGRFEAILVRIEADIHVGPAKVKDTQYSFFARGVGKVAEIEMQRVAAVLIYHSHSTTAKVLKSYPKR